MCNTQAWRIVTLNYGDNSGGVDSRANRVTSIVDSQLSASYQYAGTSRRVGMTLGSNAIVQTVAGAGGYTGLDRFGRLKDLHFTSGGTTRHRYQYGYDNAGNRTYAIAQQVDHNNDRSFLYGYDELNRLIKADRGQLQTDGSGLQYGGIVPNLTSWDLDPLGNWAGNTWGSDANQDGQPDAPVTRSHAVNSANQITGITETGLASTAIIHDRAGNMVFDGTYFYQYDGMNRLLAVCPVGMLTPTDFDADGRILESATHTPDSPVVRFVYDGLGRLIRKTATTATSVRSEDYYYGGVRRIQEVVTNTPSGAGEGSTWTDKEYVYGPDYVDEFVAQVDYQSSDSSSQVYYTLQDANYNVVALAVERRPKPATRRRLKTSHF